MVKRVRIGVLGDVVGRAGRAGLRRRVATLRRDHDLSLLIVNGENAAGGLGIDTETARELFNLGIDGITLGDHAFNRKGVSELLVQEPRIIRPANFPEDVPGRGWMLLPIEPGLVVGVLNLLGRTFIGSTVSCPFREAKRILAGPLADCSVTILDFHAEATSEKWAMGRFLDGAVSLLVGTHTHVQTADDQILDHGSGYITDLGMCGPRDGVIGMDTEAALARFLSPLPQSYKTARGDATVQGIIAEFEVIAGKNSERSSARVVELRRIHETIAV